MLRFRTYALNTFALVVALSLFAASGALAWAATEDYVTRMVVPSGVTLMAERSLAGMTADEVRETIAAEVIAPLHAPIAVAADDSTFTVDPAGHLFIDIDAAVAAAFEPVRDSTIDQRVKRLLTGTPVSHDIVPAVEVDNEILRQTIASMAARVDSQSVDATITIEFDQVVMGASAEGRAVETSGAVAAIGKALLDGEKHVTLQVDPVPPAVTEADLGQTIVVSLGSRKLTLYEGIDVDRTYRVAIGKPGFSTPRGTWEIVQKRYLPTWGNPGSAWAVDMPKTIPPGPGNPLGTRALNLNVSGIRIHGTSDAGSIGRAASHGCIRMVRRDVEELYDIVDVGTRVLIVR